MSAPHPNSVPILDRLSKRFDVSSGCWTWNGKIDKTGYGAFGLKEGGIGRTRSAHKIIYEILVGPVPLGMQLDHVCHDPLTCLEGINCPHRRCVNPDHLVIVTPRFNTLRSNSVSSFAAAKTHCVNGHKFIEKNIYRRSDDPRTRNCRECIKNRSRIKKGLI